MSLKPPLVLLVLCALVASTGCDSGGRREPESKPPGLAIRLRVVPPHGHRLTRADLDRAILVLHDRITKLGIRNPFVGLRGRRTILVLLPRFYDRGAAAVLAKTGLLEFYDFEAALSGPRRAKNAIVVRCDVARGTCPRSRYVFKRRPQLTGADVVSASVRADFDPATHVPVVVLRFKPQARRIFGAMTRREAERGAELCSRRGTSLDVPSCAQHFAIVLDRRIQSLPYVDFVRDPDGVSAATGVQIAMRSTREARQLAIVLQTGALPVRFVRLP